MGAAQETPQDGVQSSDVVEIAPHLMVGVSLAKSILQSLCFRILPATNDERTYSENLEPDPQVNTH